MRHSDKKDTFETGAWRDSEEGKGSPSLISPVLIHRLGVLLQKGAKYYGADNWMKGMKYRRTANSMIRHIFQWLAGDSEEDHLAAIAFGVMCLMTCEEELKQACSPLERMEVSQDDRCKQLKKILPSILTTPEPVGILEQAVEGVIRYHQCRGTCGGMVMQTRDYCTQCRLDLKLDVR